MPESKPVTYGEFPELFSGFPPDDPVDLEDGNTLSTLSLFGDRDVVDRLLTEERMRILSAPFDGRRAESRALLRRLQETGQADPDMDAPEEPA